MSVSLPFCAPLQVTVCWVQELPAGNGQSLSPQAEHAGIRTYFFSAENTEEQESWIQAMGEAARVQIPPTQRSAPGAAPLPCPAGDAALSLLLTRGRSGAFGTLWSRGSSDPARLREGQGHPGGTAGGW